MNILHNTLIKNINAEFISADAGKSDSSSAVLLQEIFKASLIYLNLCFSLFTTLTSVK